MALPRSAMGVGPGVGRWAVFRGEQSSKTGEGSVGRDQGALSFCLDDHYQGSMMLHFSWGESAKREIIN